MNNLSKKEIYDLRKQKKINQKTKFQKTKKMKRIFLWIFITIAIIAAVFGLYKLISLSGPASPTSFENEILSTDQVRGNPEASVVLMEYSDFQCPACRVYASMTAQLYDEYKDKVAFVYRHFPISQIHTNARLAAIASEAAGNQGKFWEMHDLLFSKQNSWSDLIRARETFIDYARTLGLDSAIFEADLDSSVTADKVESDFEAGRKAGIQGTPTFFINGLPIQNPRSYEEFKSIIDLAIQNA